MKYFKSFSLYISVIMLALLVSACGQSKHEVIVYGDFNCPHCKDFEQKIMPKMTKDYIEKDKVKFTFVNVAFLDKSSELGAAASYAVKEKAPNKFLKFNQMIFEQQGKEEINEKNLDKQIDKLGLSDKDSNNIKEEYKNKHSKVWDKVESDQKRADKDHIKEVPTVKIDDEKVKDVYDYDSIKKMLDE